MQIMTPCAVMRDPVMGEYLDDARVVGERVDDARLFWRRLDCSGGRWLQKGTVACSVEAKTEAS